MSSSENRPRIKMSAVEASIKNFSSRKEMSETGLAFSIASLMVYFNRPSIEESYRRLRNNASLSETEWKELLHKSIQLSNPGSPTDRPDESAGEINGKWILDDTTRNNTLKSFKSREQLNEMLDKISYPFDHFFQKVYTSYLSGNPLPLSKLSLDELAAAHSVCRWASGTIVSVPPEEELMTLLRQKEFLQPFEKITRHFKGRVADLEFMENHFKGTESTLTRIRKFLGSAPAIQEIQPLLITGIGGVGKSTLVAKFVLNNQTTANGQRIPIVYLDFDRPGLSVTEPLLLVRYALDQLASQFPVSKPIFDSIAREIDLKFESPGQETRSTDHELILDKYLLEFNRSKYNSLPIFLVLDSFEEIQYRANRTQLNNFLHFIKTLSNSIKGLFPIFVGRSELENLSLKFTTHSLPDFDKESAIAYLASKNVNNTELGSFVYDHFGGNPLKLQLIADQFFKSEVNNLEDFHSIYGSDQLKLEEEFSLQYLVQRNLDHTHDPRVRKIAIPGLLIRTINPSVIREVLAEICDLGPISEAEANDIYEQLSRESFLITATNNGISFRMDLRIELHRLIISKEPEKSAKLHEMAIRYYKDKNSPQDKAEYLYHLLQSGRDPRVALDNYEDAMRPYLENSLKEFSDDAKIYLAALLNIPASHTDLASVSQRAWQFYYSTLIDEALEAGDEVTLRDIANGLQARAQRDTQEDVLDYYEAKLYERLGDEKTFLACIERSFRDRKDSLFGLLPFRLLKSRYYEQKENFQEALHELELVREQMLEADEKYDAMGPLAAQILIDANFSIIRLVGRLNKQENKEAHRLAIVKIIRKFGGDPEDNNPEPVRKLLPHPYKAFYNRRFPLDSFIKSVTRSYYPVKTYLDTLNGYRTSLRDKGDLEQMINKRYGLRLTDISQPGSFDVNIIDMIQFMEIDRVRTIFRNEEKKCITICCDGIWEQETVFENGRPVETNVEKLYRLLSDRTHDNRVQLKMYDKGRGKKYNWFNRVIGIFDGKEIDFIIKDMYSFISLNYTIGDDIYIFGFSKGAYIARCLAGFINHCGLLRHEFVHKVDEAYELYRSKTSYEDSFAADLENFRRNNCYESVTPIKMLGVWETVGTLGIPRNVAIFKKARYEFWDTRLPANVQCAFHALALDEQRQSYSACLWSLPSAEEGKPRGVVLEQTWFPGVHRNIGGGYPDTGLSDISLDWMINKATDIGLCFDEISVRSEVRPNVMGNMRKPLDSILQIFRFPRKVELGTETHQHIHESVLERIQSDNKYRPANIPKSQKTQDVMKS